jgi:small-conductance mechanosensitive channel
MSLIAISSASPAQKVLLTIGLVLGIVAISAGLRAAAGALLVVGRRDRERFWAHQVVGLAALAALIAGVALLWGPSLTNPSGAVGLLAAGVAVSLQRVIASFAGYLIILRGNVFTVGDRITLGGVRGDVVALGFMQTTVLEMGQSPPEQAAEPAVWVRGRQYTGRIVRITNDKIFDSPIYNFTREFPYVWDEIRLPIHHGGDRERVEEILLTIAHRHTADIIAEARPSIDKLRYTYYITGEIELEPRVYLTITDNWLEMALRFLSREPGGRGLKNALYRDIQTEFKRAGIGIASSTSDISIVNPVLVRTAPAD